MLENTSTESSGLIGEEARFSRNYSPKKGVAFTAASCSLLAVVAVPYLVLRSVYYISNGESSDSFDQMIHSGNVGFWVFGPILAFLALVAIAPFNFYNIYKTVHDSQGIPFTSLKSFIINLMRIIFISSGSVNGFNTNLAYSDVVGADSSVSRVFQFLLVFNAVLFAGLADSRVVINYVTNEIQRDFRYINRGLNHLCYKANFFKMRNRQQRTQKRVTETIKKRLDDLHYTILLGLDHRKITHSQHLLQSQDWLNDPESNQFQEYANLGNNPFPLIRYILSDVLGGGLSLTLAYFGNKNVLEFAYKAIVEFFEYCGAKEESYFVSTFAYGVAWVGYVVGILVSYFLIRDLFFRDIFKNKDFSNIKREFFNKFLTLIPALSFGLLNVILTVMNDSLSPFSRMIVATSAIIGATVVSRYGIEGGLKEFAGKKNTRRELAALSLSIGSKLRLMNDTSLISLDTKLSCLSDDSIHLSVLSEADCVESDSLRSDSKDFSCRNQPSW